jgi:cytochrome c553
MAAPRDTTASIKECYRCGKPFDPPEKGKIPWMNIAPAKENPLMHIAMCDDCHGKDGIWWVGNIPKYEVLPR